MLPRPLTPADCACCQQRVEQQLVDLLSIVRTHVSPGVFSSIEDQFVAQCLARAAAAAEYQGSVSPR